MSTKRTKRPINKLLAKQQIVDKIDINLLIVSQQYKGYNSAAVSRLVRKLNIQEPMDVLLSALSK